MLKRQLTGFLAMALAAVMLAGCGARMAPAQKAIAEIEANVTAAGADATFYIPDQVAAITAGVDDLKAKFAKKDYKAVLDGAPALLAQAKALGPAAATAKAAAMEQLSGDWALLASTLPKRLTAIQSRINLLSNKLAEATSPLPAGIDQPSIDKALAESEAAATLWSQATTAQAAGDLTNAVDLAKQVKDKTNTLLSSLGMNAG